MFMFKAKEIIKEIDKFTPDTLLSCKKALSNSVLDLDFQRLEKIHLKDVMTYQLI